MKERFSFMKRKFVLILSIVFMLSVTQAAFAAIESKVDKVSNSNTSVTNITDLINFRLGSVANIKFNALLQGWSIQNQNESANDQRFRLRRAELKLSGTVADSSKYFFMIDPSRLIVPPGGTS